MHDIVWSDAALAQLDAIGTYIEQFNPKAVTDPAVKLIAAGNSLATFPHRGRPLPGTTLRELIITTYPYTIRYRIGSDAVRV